MASKQLLAALARVRDVPVAPYAAALASVVVESGAKAGPGQASARRFARTFLPVLAYRGGDGVAVSRVTTAGGQAAPRIVATFADGTTRAFDTTKTRDADVFDALAGAGAAGALGAAPAALPRKRRRGAKAGVTAVAPAAVAPA